MLSLSHSWTFLASWSTLLLLLMIAPSAPAEDALHARIDRLLAAGRPASGQQASSQAPDAEFLRRVYLDLVGTIPTAGEVRTFLGDPSADKRAELIDRLLASPEHARRLQTVFDVMLMERRPDKHVPRGQWQEYLRASFAENKPWDQLVREILSADGADPKTRPAAKFYLEREGEPNALARDVGRLLLGMNLTCAQCHDHPVYLDYKQGDYYGLFAFFNRSFLFTGKDRVAVFAEKAEGEASYQSVFDPAKVTKTTGPRVPGGAVIEEPEFDKGQEYEVAPAKGVRPVPKFSRRAQLAPQLANAANAAFKRNIANRLWALLMGRGLIHPLDLDHTDNPPSHPELLDLLADEIAAHQFDIRWFLRELALTQVYQRASEHSASDAESFPGAEAADFSVAHLKPLSPEQLAWAMMQATGVTDAERRALGAKANEASLYARLNGKIAPFVTAFGSLPAQAEEYQATLDQALFLANGAQVRQWLAPRPGNLMDRLAPLSDPDALAEELYLSILTRLPTAAERKEAAEFLKALAGARDTALQELAWALLASAEFRFNH